MKFKMSNRLEHVKYEIRGPIAEEAEQMSAKGIHIVKLNTGNPAPFGLYAPSDIMDDMVKHFEMSQGYSHSKGLLEARNAIASYSRSKGIEGVAAEDIFTGNGVSELISISVQALLNQGDEILIPAPDYPLWTAASTLVGGKVVHYVCDEYSNWYPDIDDIRRKVTDKTKAIVIINPNNPTGAVYPKEILLGIIKVAREHNLVIFSDEIYDRLVMDKVEHISTASLALDLLVVTFNGLSKSHRIAGFRCGWLCISGDRKAAKGYIEGINMLASMRLCSNVISQSVIKNALLDANNADNLIEPGGRLYEQREYITKALNQIPGITAVKPKAAFYIFPKIDMQRFRFEDDEDFVLKFLKEKHVLLTQGTGFNWSDTDHFRLVYLPELKVLKQIIDDLTDFMERHRREKIK